MTIANKKTFWGPALGKLTLALLAVTIAGNAQAGQVGHYRMDNLTFGAGGPDVGEFFTFSVDDKNGDGIASSDEIFDFSGIECNFCADANDGKMKSTIVTLGKVGNDVLFGGSGEATFNLTTFNWTYTITGANEPPVNRVLAADFGWSDADGNGVPMRLVAPLLQIDLWSATVVSDVEEVEISQESLDTAQQMYVAYYGRPGDPGGRDFWAEQFDLSNNLDAVLSAFGNSDEFNDSFGALSAEELVNGLFQRMFNRDSDPDGLAFYVGRLTPDDEGNTDATLASIAKQIADGAVEDDLTALNNKIGIANVFTDRVETEAFTYDEDDIINIRALLAAVNSEEASKATGFDAVTDWIAD